MKGKWSGLCLGCLLLLANSHVDAANGQTAVRVVELAPVEARSASTFSNVFGVSVLRGNRLLVNDGVQRRLTILDANFRPESVLLDSAASGSSASASSSDRI